MLAPPLTKPELHQRKIRVTWTPLYFVRKAEPQERELLCIQNL